MFSTVACDSYNPGVTVKGFLVCAKGTSRPEKGNIRRAKADVVLLAAFIMAL